LEVQSAFVQVVAATVLCRTSPELDLCCVFHLPENSHDMLRDSANFPRRYLANGEGHRVIVGLTPDETSEFEALDRHQGDPLHGAAASDRPVMTRWLELYAKHAAAWDDWMRQSKVDRDNDLLPAM